MGVSCVSLALCYFCTPGVFAPTEWSAFMSIIAGIVQAVTTLQIALGDRVGVKVIKTDK